jgi:hypothetical protein
METIREQVYTAILEAREKGYDDPVIMLQPKTFLAFKRELEANYGLHSYALDREIVKFYGATVKEVRIDEDL